jgi:hypothetical protein
MKRCPRRLNFLRKRHYQYWKQGKIVYLLMNPKSIIVIWLRQKSIQNQLAVK